MQKITAPKAGQKRLSEDKPSFTRPVWGDTKKSCDACNYNEQDIDTFPCAKCHTRH